jgi:hypothetical protein
MGTIYGVSESEALWQSKTRRILAYYAAGKKEGLSAQIGASLRAT